MSFWLPLNSSFAVCIAATVSLTQDCSGTVMPINLPLLFLDEMFLYSSQCLSHWIEDVWGTVQSNCKSLLLLIHVSY